MLDAETGKPITFAADQSLLEKLETVRGPVLVEFEGLGPTCGRSTCNSEHRSLGRPAQRRARRRYFEVAEIATTSGWCGVAVCWRADYPDSGGGKSSRCSRVDLISPGSNVAVASWVQAPTVTQNRRPSC